MARQAPSWRQWRGEGVGMVRTGEANEEGLWGPIRGELNPSCALTRGGGCV